MGDRNLTRGQVKREKKRSGEKKKRRIFYRLGLMMLIIGFLVAAGIGITVMAYVNDAPKLDSAHLQTPQSSTIYDMDDQAIMDLAGTEYRKAVKLDQVPKHVQDAFVAVEDARFWEHNGIDVKRIAGAVAANFKDGFGAEGASTITQQLVKRSFLSPEKSIKRKVNEAYLALQMEKKFSKKEILEMYLNNIYFGKGAYGIETASQVFFNKTAGELDISEAALLAGLPQRPSGYDPFKHPELAETRRNTVLALMQKHGIITDQERHDAQAMTVPDMLHEQARKTAYDGFVDVVLRELKAEGISETDLYTSGLHIYTTMDAEAQQLTDKILTTDEYISYPDDEFRAGAALLDTKTGEIRAIGSDRIPGEQGVKRGYNYAVQLKRPPGSTAKPIMAYGPAIETLKWPTAKEITDEEIELNGKTFKNWDNRFHGDVSVRTALQWSYNIPAIKAMEEAGHEAAKDFASKLGIQLEEIYPPYAIGGFKYGVSPLQLAGAYAAFGNGGQYNKPHAVRKVVYPDGKELEFSRKPVKAMSGYTAYMITDMLKTVVREGTGRVANIEGLPLAGKTGTNELPENFSGEGVKDAWFAGYTTRYSAAVWTGYDKTTEETYVRKKDEDIAKLIFKSIVAEVSEGEATEDFVKPDSVVEVRYDKETGLKATKYTPEGRISTELFVKGTPLTTGKDTLKSKMKKTKTPPRATVIPEEPKEEEKEDDAEKEKKEEENVSEEEQAGKDGQEDGKKPEQPQPPKDKPGKDDGGKDSDNPPLKDPPKDPPENNGGGNEGNKPPGDPKPPENEPGGPATVPPPAGQPGSAGGEKPPKKNEGDGN